MDLSIVDLAPVPPGGSTADAFATSLALARQAEASGYRRFWVAEHHGIGSAVASCCPEALMAAVAAATTGIRVGSGTVLLNYTKPLKVAETFRALHALFPNRIDLGMGRAGSIPAVEAALTGSRPGWDLGGVTGSGGAEAGGAAAGGTAGLGGAEAGGAAGGAAGLGGLGGGDRGAATLDALAAWMAHEDQVAEVMAWLDDAFGPGDPRRDVTLAHGVAGGPETWLLGSSPTSALLAGRLGMRYGFAAFFNPEAAAMALRAYRAAFQPSPFPSGATAPEAMLAVNVCCAETDRDADRLRASVELFYRRGGGSGHRALQEPDAAIAELGGIPGPTVATPGMWPRHLSGSPGRVRALLEQYAAETGADEVMIQDLIADPLDRLRSYQLIAEAFGTTAAGDTASQNSDTASQNSDTASQNSSRLSRNCS